MYINSFDFVATDSHMKLKMQQRYSISYIVVNLAFYSLFYVHLLFEWYICCYISPFLLVLNKCVKFDYFIATVQQGDLRYTSTQVRLLRSVTRSATYIRVEVDEKKEKYDGQCLFRSRIRAFVYFVLTYICNRKKSQTKQQFC